MYDDYKNTKLLATCLICGREEDIGTKDRRLYCCGKVMINKLAPGQLDPRD